MFRKLRKFRKDRWRTLLMWIIHWKIIPDTAYLKQPSWSINPNMHYLLYIIDMRWNPWDEKIKKAKTNIGIIKHLVRPHFDYCDIIYHIPPSINQPPQLPTFNSIMEKLERVQYQAALAVTGAWQGSNWSKLNEELGWETLSDRRMCRRILQIQKSE